MSDLPPCADHPGYCSTRNMMNPPIEFFYFGIVLLAIWLFISIVIFPRYFPELKRKEEEVEVDE